jgi:hypothetical protein
MENLVKSIQAQGRFVDKKPAFSDLADDRLAREVAKELGYKVNRRATNVSLRVHRKTKKSQAAGLEFRRPNPVVS